MSLNINNQNEENEDNENEENILTITDFKKYMFLLIDNCVYRDNKTEMLIVQHNITLFDYLVETQNFWKNNENLKSFKLTVKNKLLEYKKTASKSFEADKYLKILGYYCSYETKNSKLCQNNPVNGICMFHRKFDNKLKLNVTNNTPLIKDLHNIIINYIR
jgi:hypothetical protein